MEIQMDTVPWYRQFWPWFLIALPGAVVIAGLTTVAIAVYKADDLVADEYYKEGLAINRSLDKLAQAAELNLQAEFNFSGDEIFLELAGQGKAAVLSLMVSHPLEADRDFSILLERSAPGVYQGELIEPLAGNWHWRLEPAIEPSWRLQGSFNLEQASL